MFGPTNDNSSNYNKQQCSSFWDNTVWWALRYLMKEPISHFEDRGVVHKRVINHQRYERSGVNYVTRLACLFLIIVSFFFVGHRYKRSTTLSTPFSRFDAHCLYLFTIFKKKRKYCEFEVTTSLCGVKKEETTVSCLLFWWQLSRILLLFLH